MRFPVNFGIFLNEEYVVFINSALDMFFGQNFKLQERKNNRVREKY